VYAFAAMLALVLPSLIGGLAGALLLRYTPPAFFTSGFAAPPRYALLGAAQSTDDAALPVGSASPTPMFGVKRLARSSARSS